MPDGVELGAQRGVHHAAAKLDHEPADDGGIDFDIKIDVLAADRFERALQRSDMIVLELFGNSNLGGGLALIIGDQLAEPLDHVAHREQAAVRRHQLDEFCCKPADPGALKNRRQRLQLLIGGKHRAANEPHQVRALGDQRIEAIEVRFHRVDRVAVARQIEQSGGIAARHAGYDGFFACQVCFSSPARELFRKGATGAGSRRKPLGIKPWD